MGLPSGGTFRGERRAGSRSQHFPARGSYCHRQGGREGQQGTPKAERAPFSPAQLLPASLAPCVTAPGQGPDSRVHRPWKPPAASDSFAGRRGL